MVASGQLEKLDRLVLADFENRTTDSTLGPSLTEALRVDLAQSPVVRLLDGAAVGRALGRMGRKSGTALDVALARELAQREGAKAVVHGEIDPVGRSYVLSADLLSAVGRHGARHTARERQGQRGDHRGRGPVVGEAPRADRGVAEDEPGERAAGAGADGLARGAAEGHGGGPRRRWWRRRQRYISPHGSDSARHPI